MTATQRLSGRARWSLLGFVLGVLCTGLPLPALAAGELTIRGRVLDEQGNPAAHAQVFALCTGALPEGPFIDCGFPALLGRKGVTDEAGSFTLEKLPRALYSVYAAIQAPGPGDKIAAEAALPIALRADMDGIELRLKPPSSQQDPVASKDGARPEHSISGKVVDSSGAPVPHASVTANLQNPSSEQRLSKGAGALKASGYAETDASGQFMFKDLFEGSYTLSAYTQVFLKSERTVHTAQGPVTLQVKRRGVVRGRVLMPDGTPATSLISNCETLAKSPLPEGRFELFSGTEQGVLKLCLSAPGMSPLRRTVTVLPDQALELGELRLEPARVLKVQLTDLRSGQPVNWAEISVASAPQQTSYFTQPDGKTVISDFADMELDLDVRATGYLPTRFHVLKGQTEVKGALDPGVLVSGRALDGQGQPQIGTVSGSCGKGGSAQGYLDTEGRFQLQGLTGGLCSVSLMVISAPIQSFENTRYFWVAGKGPISLEFQAPAERHPLHLRFEGAGKAHHALLFVGELPEQMELGPTALQGSVIAQSWMPEVAGYRGAVPEEQGLRFNKIGAGRYTLVVLVDNGFFRAPLTVGDKEETLTVVIPAVLTPLPK